jgi:hypothetical protein
MKDPFVQEVRKYRMKHTQRFKADLHLICEDLRQYQNTLGDRVVTLEPRRIQPKNGRGTLAKARRTQGTA